MKDWDGLKKKKNIASLNHYYSVILGKHNIIVYATLCISVMILYSSPDKVFLLWYIGMGGIFENNIGSIGTLVFLDPHVLE